MSRLSTSTLGDLLLKHVPKTEPVEDIEPGTVPRLVMAIHDTVTIEVTPRKQWPVYYVARKPSSDKRVAGGSQVFMKASVAKAVAWRQERSLRRTDKWAGKPYVVYANWVDRELLQFLNKGITAVISRSTGGWKLLTKEEIEEHILIEETEKKVGGGTQIHVGMDMAFGADEKEE